MDQLVAPVRPAVTAASWVLTAGSAQAFLVMASWETVSLSPSTVYVPE